jgi:hypothetical protein
MGKTIDVNGLEVEICDILALRQYGTLDCVSGECVPSEGELQVGGIYPFLKSGCRIWNLLEPIPLIVTQGNKQFTEAIGLVNLCNISIRAKSQYCQ